MGLSASAKCLCWNAATAVVLLAACACPAREAVGANARQDGYKRPAFKHARVFVQTAAGELPVRVEVARSEEERIHGLMFKERLAEDEGMIFLFDKTADHVFWMKNTPLPLDMVFLGEDRKVVGIHENAQPLSLTRVSVGQPSRYVLEVRGGWCRAQGVAPGAQVRFEGIED